MKSTHRGIAVGILGALLLALIVWWALGKPRRDPAPVMPAVAKTAEPSAKPSMLQAENRPAIPPDPKQRISVSGDTAAGEAPIEHMLRGIIASSDDSLGLTRAEIDRLVAETLEFHEIHTELISRYLQETNFDPNAVTLHVPPFPLEGKALRDMYLKRLSTDFPADKFNVIVDRLGGFVDQSFRGFGIADQTFTLTRSTEQPGAFELSWEVKVPEGQLPGAVNPGMSYPGSTGRALLTREQIASGEYRFLAPVVEKRFPENPRNTP